ncbi:MAG TPA: dihydrofolate reductase [Burkholderiales bacterium]|nr:dihydrofolate reductase [Burkholderiales bacterium]
MRPIISLIAAVSRNGVIGIRNSLPWHLPADLRYFKQLTLGHAIVMGRKTFDSIGRPLPGRTNIVISREAYQAPQGTEAVNSIDAAIALCDGQSEVFFIGGGEIFQQIMGLAQRLYLTEIDADIPDGDAWFPEFDRTAWTVTRRESHYDEASQCAFDFVVYERKNK